jgi:4-amino-4-deoxy-L-arabinose transferase-like glycosyltransferase
MIRLKQMVFEPTAPELLEQVRPAPAASHWWRSTEALLFTVLILCAVRFWLMPLPSSFWVDEMATAFVVQHGAADPTLAVAPQVPASLYYVLPAAAQWLFGFSEVAYRLPSVLAIAIALFLIGRIAARLIHPGAAWFAVFTCLALRPFNYEAADARPYALATCLACAAIWFLMRWLDDARWLDAVLFVATAALLWRVHLILWPLYILFAGYTAWRLIRSETAVSWRAVFAAFGVLAVLLIPVLMQAMALYGQAAAHVIAPVPALTDLFRSLNLGLISAFCAAAALLSRWRWWPMVRPLPSNSACGLVLGWWLCQPVCLFAFSSMTHNSVFVPRYLSVALPGAALACTLTVAVFTPPRYWRTLSLFLGCGVLLFVGSWKRVWPPHHNSDWRAAAAALAVRSLGADVPLIAPSPFVEAKEPVWRPDYPVSSFLYCHLLVYPVPGKIYPFPFDSSPQVERYAKRLTAETLSPSDRFVIYGDNPKVLYWQDWFAARPELLSWRARKLGPYGDVSIVIFEKP